MAPGPDVAEAVQVRPPHWRVFEAVVDEVANWWVVVEDESVPKAVVTDMARPVTYSSPWLQRPGDTTRFTLGLDRDGCVLTTEVETAHPSGAVEAATRRHRLGERLDRDLRSWLDGEYRARAYRVCVSRSDIVAWAARGRREEGQFWQATEEVRGRVLPGLGSAADREALLQPGTVMWVLGRQRTAARLLGPTAGPVRRGGRDRKALRSALVRRKRACRTHLLRLAGACGTLNQISHAAFSVPEVPISDSPDCSWSGLSGAHYVEDAAPDFAGYERLPAV